MTTADKIETTFEALLADLGSDASRRSYRGDWTQFCAWRHADCFTTLVAWAERLAPEERQRIGEQLAGLNQGFLTSKGRFVDRQEAMALAQAAGLTSSDKRDLFSEDLY